MDVSTAVLALLLLAAAGAGWVDAVAGGGGLVQLPSILAAGVLQPVAGGVNKVSSGVGTLGALFRYARAGHVRWGEVPFHGGLACAGSALGSYVLVQVARSAQTWLTPVFAVAFVALAVHLLAKTFFPRPPHVLPRRRPVVGAAMLFAVGCYDGFIGPGAGIFLFWTLTTCFVLSPLDGTGTTKALNACTNAGALVPLILSGSVAWPLALSMAGANFVGGQLGAHTTLRRGAAFVRFVAACVAVAASVYLLVKR